MNLGVSHDSEGENQGTIEILKADADPVDADMKEVMETYAFLANQSLFGAFDPQTDATSPDGPDRVANMTKVDLLDCRCTWTRHETIKALMSQNTTATSICVSDSGADSCIIDDAWACLLYTSPSPRDQRGSRMPSSA